MVFYVCNLSINSVKMGVMGNEIKVVFTFEGYISIIKNKIDSIHSVICPKAVGLMSDILRR